MTRRRRLMFVMPALTLAACGSQPGQNDNSDPNGPGFFQAVVNTELVPTQATIQDAAGNPRSIAASRDPDGVQSEFVVGEVLVRASEAELNDFLSRFGGTVLRDNRIPEPPPELGITLSAEERAPTRYLVRVNLAAIDASAFPENARELNVGGMTEFSSDEGLQTLACVAGARAAGFKASLNYLSRPDQVFFPTPLFQTQEGPNPPAAAGFADAFTITRCLRDTLLTDGLFDLTVPPAAPPGGRTCNPVFQTMGTTGSQSNVTLAWQFVAAHGITRRVKVAIIDSGFWLNPDGTPWAVDTDFPPGPGPGGRLFQFDDVDVDGSADGPSAFEDTSSFWHGTGSAGVAAGVLNNRAGTAGTGGLVADPMLFKIDGTEQTRDDAIRGAVAWGADVISMSFSKDCDTWCGLTEDSPVDDAFNRGNKTVFVASAGNGCHTGDECPPTPAVGYDAGDFSVHPCAWDHVICVGALNNDAATAQSYSNFGRNVAIFAPTNIPVMLRPTTSDPAGPVALSTFGGTSASAPFVAGVAAMMKAINPDLNSDDVYRILRETAHRGTAPVDYYIDAFAAVHRAAEGIAIVPDRFEPNNGPGAPATLGGFAPYSAPDLNLSAADQDWFKFESPGASQMTINLQSPSGLGHISVISLLSLGETCGSPELISDSPGTNTRVLTYNVPGGPLQLGLRADDVNAYNLTISFTAAAVAPDIYEVNDDVAAAKYIHGFAPGTGTFGAEFVIHPSVTIEATLHNSAAPADTDYYIVRGASLSNAETALLSGGPFLSVYANTASIAMQVFLLNADGTQGAGVFEGSALSCAQGLAATLQSDVYYLVRVAGFPGQYTLFNGAIADPALLPPILVGGFPGEIIQPGPVEIERNLAFPELFLFLADPAFDTVVSDNPAVHLSLFALGGELLAEGAASGAGERLSIANLQATQGYALKAEPTDLSAGPLRLRLEWESAAPLRASENLIANPGAEIAVGPDPDQFIPYWDIESSATTLVYGDQPGDPSLSDPGPADRGLTFFAGGTDNSSSAILQVIEVDPAWQEAINAGRVRFRFAAFLGGNLQQADSASGRLIFRRSSSDEGVISEVSLPAVTPLDRAGQTSLFPVEVHDHVPADTTIMIVEVRFTGGQGNFNDGYADNLELVLSEYPQ